MIPAYPLQWPMGWPRTAYPDRALFKTPGGRAMQNLLNELRQLQATDVVISSNVMLRQDGYPYANQRRPEDCGVAVYFKLAGEDQCIPCDKWNDVDHNIHAIGLTVGALRGLERWGAKEMVNAAFRGFKALPESIIMGAGTSRPWHDVLEVSPNASPEIIRAAYRNLSKRKHPDAGGSEAEFLELQKALKESGA